MNEDKRRYPRADLVFRLKYAAHDQTRETVSRDISGGGISIEVGSALLSGTELDLNFSIDGLPGEITARGRVIRSWQEAGKIFCALEFTAIDESDREIVEDFIKAHLKLGS